MYRAFLLLAHASNAARRALPAAAVITAVVMSRRVFCCCCGVSVSSPLMRTALYWKWSVFVVMMSIGRLVRWTDR
jgi:hypothetical protein